MKAAKFAAILSFLASSFALPERRSLAKRADSTPRLLTYVQTFTEEGSGDHLSLLPLIQDNTGITHVILAALHLNSNPGDITLNDDNPNSTVFDATWSEASTLQQSGVKVIVMMGGEAQGTYNGRICNSDDGSINHAFYDPLVSTLKFHNVDGIDLDIEEAVPISCPENLVAQLNADFGSDFIITMAPVASDLTPSQQGLGGFSYKDFDSTSSGARVNWYNTQYYSGFVEGSIEQSYEAAVGNGFSASRVVMGVLDSGNDGGGFMALGDVEGTINNLKGEFSDFGGVDGFEYFDAGSSDGLSEPWMWVQQIGNTEFGTANKKRSSRVLHTPPLPPNVAILMAEGHGQLDSAIAVRRARGNLARAREILSELGLVGDD